MLQSRNFVRHTAPLQIEVEELKPIEFVAEVTEEHLDDPNPVKTTQETPSPAISP